MIVQRASTIAELERSSFDLVVVGGGITGSCLAYDAASRGLKVALLERGDFGEATSASSSKLLHSGIRFLQQLRPDKVRQSALEREHFRTLVPHLCQTVPFIIPAYARMGQGRLTLGIAKAAFQVLSASRNSGGRKADPPLDAPSLASRREVADRVPWLENDRKLCGALVLPELHMRNSERVTWSFVSGAAKRGAAVANYVKALEILCENGIAKGVDAIDSLSGHRFRIRSSFIANCTGPWLPELAPNGNQYSKHPITAYFRGAHLLLDRDDLDCAVALATRQRIHGVSTRGGRHMFLIPWRRRILVGTSYAPHTQGLDSVSPTSGDILQLKHGINDAAGFDLVETGSIVHAYAGIYPLDAANIQSSVYQGTAQFRILNHARDGIANYISVFGAKFTTARLVAEHACDIIAKISRLPLMPCRTRIEPTPAGDFSDIDTLAGELETQQRPAIQQEQLRRLVRQYGTDAREIVGLIHANPSLSKPIGPEREEIAAEAIHAVRSECVVRLSDFIFRRTGIGTIGSPGRHYVEACADIVGRELGWPVGEREAQISDVLQKLEIETDCL